MLNNSNSSNLILKPIIIRGKEVYPLIDGGKGISFTNGTSAGLWANKNGIGTLSCAAADSYDSEGKIVPYVFHSNNRIDKHEELIKQEIAGGIAQVKKAYEAADGKGRIQINVLWDMGGTVRILHGILQEVASLIDTITAGAGIPYDLSRIAAQYGVGFLPIVSGVRVTRILWKRSYSKYADIMDGVVYEDPWKAGGHNGLSNQENPKEPQDPYNRILEIRKFMNSVGLEDKPIFMAGGVWHLNEWKKYMNNPELGPMGFQIGTRTLVTQENPSPIDMKMAFLESGAKGQKVHLHNFSPTGMYSSALENTFLRKLQARKNHEVEFSKEQTDEFTESVKFGPRKREIFVKTGQAENVLKWIDAGRDAGLPTPDNTMIFVSSEEAKEILKDQRECKGCLRGCKFSGWYQEPVNNHSTGIAPDPRSFCIFNTLHGASHGKNVDNELMFAGHTVYRFASDPFYKNQAGDWIIPSISDLFDRILTGY